MVEFSACIVCQVVRLYSVVARLPMALGMCMFMKVMSSLISVMSPPPCLCSLSVRMVVYRRCFRFMCEFCLLYRDDARLGTVFF